MVVFELITVSQNFKEITLFQMFRSVRELYCVSRTAIGIYIRLHGMFQLRKNGIRN